MSHRSVRLLLRDVANSLADNVEFKGGRQSEFNNLKNKATRYRWLLPLQASPRFAVNNTHNYMKTWNVAILFMQKDKFDADADETNLIHDEQDLAVDQFMNRLNDWSETSRDVVGQIIIQNISQTPFYKDEADVYSGWLLRFQLVTPDDFEYCTPDNITIYAGNY